MTTSSHDTHNLDSALATLRQLIARRAIQLDPDCTDTDFFDAIRDASHLDPTMNDLLTTYDRLLMIHPFPPTYDFTTDSLMTTLMLHHAAHADADSPHRLDR